MLNFTEKTKRTFDKVSETLFQSLRGNEDLVLNLSAEDSLFVRFNNCKVRQNTQIEQIVLSLQLQVDGKTTQISFSLSGHEAEDIQRAQKWLGQARQECAQLPPDPFQVALVNNGASESFFKGHLPKTEEVIECLLQPAAGKSDLAGLFCSGPIISANKNSKGQSHWFSTENFFMDYSLYDGEKAVKSVYAGTHWDQAAYERNIRHSQNQLALMARPKKVVPRGEYRTYLAPGAVAEILGLLGWGALSYADYKRGNSSLRKLADKEKSFSPLFQLKENFSLGLTPRFNELGELAPESMNLIHAGQLSSFLTSSRSAKEYDVASTNASASESPRSLELLPGSLKQEDILKELGTGLYLSNLHYLNWSDRQNARFTGMTRYACFWVENGEIVSPIADLRFDESLFDCFGTHLLALTDSQEIDPFTGTYEARQLGGKKNPGALISQFKFTL